MTEKAEKTSFCILIVDDTPENIDVLTGTLAKKYKCKAAINGVSALKVASSKNPPDLILLDIMMPEMDGFEVCKRLKANKRTKNIPVIFVTAMDSSADEAKGLAIGAIDYITKPISPPVVLARVANTLALQEARQRVQVALNQTVTGCVELMSDLLSITNPTAFGQSNALRRQMRASCERLGHRPTWAFDVAAMLSQIGCLTLPEELLERVYRGDPLAEDEQTLYDNHPQTALRLLERIPNLKTAANIIALQRQDLNEADALKDVPPQIRLGASLLQTALDMQELERRRTYIPPPPSAPSPAAAVESEGAGMMRDVLVEDIRTGMRIESQIDTIKGTPLIKPGTEVTRTTLERLRSFLESGMLPADKRYTITWV